MCQNISLQSHYVKCHRYEVIDSPKYTWFHLKIHTKLPSEERSGNLSLFHHSLAEIFRG